MQIKQTIRTKCPSPPKTSFGNPHFERFLKSDQLNADRKTPLAFTCFCMRKSFHARPREPRLTLWNPLTIELHSTNTWSLPTTFQCISSSRTSSLLVILHTFSMTPKRNLSIVFLHSPLGNGQFLKPIFLTHSVELSVSIQPFTFWKPFEMKFLGWCVSSLLLWLCISISDLPRIPRIRMRRITNQLSTLFQ